MVLGTVPSSDNPLTDTVPRQVIPQYEYVDMITNTLSTTENMCYIWCDKILINNSVCVCVCVCILGNCYTKTIYCWYDNLYRSLDNMVVAIDRHREGRPITGWLVSFTAYSSM